LPIKQVVAVDGETFSDQAGPSPTPTRVKGKLVNSGKYDGLGL
jgi:leucyl-tRNA synthetase